MDNESPMDLTIQHYIWIVLLSTLGILFAIYVLQVNGTNPPLFVFIISSIGTGLTGAIIGVVIGNIFDRLHKALRR